MSKKIRLKILTEKNYSFKLFFAQCYYFINSDDDRYLPVKMGESQSFLRSKLRSPKNSHTENTLELHINTSEQTDAIKP